MSAILATRNPGKAEEIKALFAGSSVHIRTLAEAGIDGNAREGMRSLADNAVGKARFAWRAHRPRVYCMADDTGLFIDVLGGKPGVLSARWAGKDASTEETMRHTLQQLRRFPKEEDRTATFRTIAAVISPRGVRHLFVGSIKGIILCEPRCQCRPSMPYSAIFMPNGCTKVWAEMSIEEENRISHRGQAFRKVREFLEQEASI